MGTPVLSTLLRVPHCQIPWPVRVRSAALLRLTAVTRQPAVMKESATHPSHAVILRMDAVRMRQPRRPVIRREGNHAALRTQTAVTLTPAVLLDSVLLAPAVIQPRNAARTRRRGRLVMERRRSSRESRNCRLGWSEAKQHLYVNTPPFNLY